MSQPAHGKALLRIENLAVSFPGGRGQPRVQAVRGVSMTIYPGQTVAVVGESGSGKSVTAMSTLRLIPTPPGVYETGRIMWAGDEGAHREPIDLLRIPDKHLRRVRGNQIAMIFQEPMTSLNPVYTIGEQILEAIRLHQQLDRNAAVERAVKALDEVGLAAPRQRLSEYPHQLSGGMRQRVMIAMALACQPQLLLADEPTTALDVTIQAQILELLRRLQREHDMAVMLITHDLGVVAENADVVAVMFQGRIVEYGTVHDVFADPLHSYTRGLFESMPVLGQRRERLQAFNSEALSTAGDRGPDGGEGAAEGGTSRRSEPVLKEVKPEHWVAVAADSDVAGEVTAPDSAYRRDEAVAAG